MADEISTVAPAATAATDASLDRLLNDRFAGRVVRKDEAWKLAA